MVQNVMAAAFAVQLNPVRWRIYYYGNLAVLARRYSGRKPNSAINAAWWLNLRNIYVSYRNAYHRSLENGVRLGLRWISAAIQKLNLNSSFLWYKQLCSGLAMGAAQFLHFIKRDVGRNAFQLLRLTALILSVVPTVP